MMQMMQTAMIHLANIMNYDAHLNYMDLWRY